MRKANAAAAPAMRANELPYDAAPEAGADGAAEPFGADAPPFDAWVGVDGAL